jgi:hypothetical protein
MIKNILHEFYIVASWCVLSFICVFLSTFTFSHLTFHNVLYTIVKCQFFLENMDISQ